jgi:hypothetical protein
MTPPAPARNDEEFASTLLDVLAYARCVVTTEGDGPDLYDLATELCRLGPIDGTDWDADLELRITAAEGMLDALCGKGYHDDYGNTDMGTRQALAYCGGFCLIAPGGEYHRDRVREIMVADDAAQPPPESWSAGERGACSHAGKAAVVGTSSGRIPEQFRNRM